MSPEDEYDAYAESLTEEEKDGRRYAKAVEKPPTPEELAAVISLIKEGKYRKMSVARSSLNPDTLPDLGPYTTLDVSGLYPTQKETDAFLDGVILAIWSVCGKKFVYIDLETGKPVIEGEE